MIDGFVLMIAGILGLMFAFLVGVMVGGGNK